MKGNAVKFCYKISTSNTKPYHSKFNMERKTKKIKLFWGVSRLKRVIAFWTQITCGSTAKQYFDLASPQFGPTVPPLFKNVTYCRCSFTLHSCLVQCLWRRGGLTVQPKMSHLMMATPGHAQVKMKFGKTKASIYLLLWSGTTLWSKSIWGATCWNSRGSL